MFNKKLENFIIIYIFVEILLIMFIIIKATSQIEEYAERCPIINNVFLNNINDMEKIDGKMIFYSYITNEDELKQLKEMLLESNEKILDFFTVIGQEKESINEFLDTQYKKAVNENKIMMIVIDKEGYQDDTLTYKVKNGKNIYLVKKINQYRGSQGWIYAISLDEKCQNYNLNYKEM